MIGKNISQRTSYICAAISIAVLIGSYTYMSYVQHVRNASDRTIPSWIQLKDGLVFLCQKPKDEQGTMNSLLAAALKTGGMEQSASKKKDQGFLEGRILWEASKKTLGRLFSGLSLGFLGGVILGILTGCFLKIDAAVSPAMYFASRIIPTAAMPIFFNVAGIDLEMYVAMIVFGSMPMVTLTVSQYVQDFPEELRHKAYTLGASHAEVITKAVFPYVLPRILDLAVIMIGPALVYLIAAEQIVAGEGFGYRIRVLTKATRFEVVYPLIIILTIYAAAITWGLNRLRKHFSPWYKAEKK